MMTIIVTVTQLVNGKITTTITIMDIETTTPIPILILTPTPMPTTTITIVTEQNTTSITIDEIMIVSEHII